MNIYLIHYEINDFKFLVFEEAIGNKFYEYKILLNKEVVCYRSYESYSTNDSHRRSVIKL